MNNILRLSFLFSILVTPVLSYSATGVQFGRIVEMKGSGFISYQGQTHEIKKGEVVYANSEIIVESSGQVTFTDNADHRFFIGNASTAAVFAGNVELRSGDLWVQSLNKLDDYKLTTANAVVNYQGGEAILSYDSDKGKTQLMVINGLMKLSNLRAPELNLTVSEGNFSFVDMSFEEGMPRDPTPVGEKTYGQLVSLFPGVAPMDKHSAEIFKDNAPGKNLKSRSVASVEETPLHSEVGTSAIEKKYLAEVMGQKSKTRAVANATHAAAKKSSTPKASKLIVNIYGLEGTSASVTTAIYDIHMKESLTEKTRAPASVPEVDSTVLDQAVPKLENMNTIPTTPKYKESVKLLEELNKL
jgi:hypothetical protein